MRGVGSKRRPSKRLVHETSDIDRSAILGMYSIWLNVCCVSFSNCFLGRKSVNLKTIKHDRSGLRSHAIEMTGN